MWPDDLDLTSELAAAGARARDAAAALPDASYAASLRDRLVGGALPAVGAAAVAAPIRALPRRSTSVRERFASRRMAPLLAAALLLVAVAAAARTVLVATDPAPLPTPAASLAVIAGPAGGGLIDTPSASPTSSPSPSPAATPTPTATATPSPSPTPGPTPASVATPAATPVPTLKPPPPTPAPAPPVGTMALAVSGCNGGVVLEWSKLLDARFHHYTTLRGASADIPAAYPPQGGAIEVAGTFIKDPAATSATDASAPAGTTLHYRTIALDAGNVVIAASPVRAAVAKPVVGLGPLGATPADPGKTTFAWAPYPGPGACFTYYKLVYSETDPSPSYLAGSATWAAVGDQATTSITIAEPIPGTTYRVRLQAIRATATGRILVAQTDVLTWVAP